MLTSDVPWAVFRGDPRADDIRQGGVGNCWLVCALSVLADVAPWTLRDAVLTKDYNPAGAAYQFFAMLYSYKESGFAVGASTFVSDGALEVEMRGLGLQAPQRLACSASRPLTARLVKLRNPNGVALWKGPGPATTRAA
ncbi:calcium-dependent cysteine-type endopeptidase [Aureococcus anophagefferens]|nr:calcium-dependent cysteine-type endopeptidase [Aureococcus anophagefferens]